MALVGATASGKSALAHELALREGDVDIVSVDAMCVYRGMDLATAKPTSRERVEVPYHLLDLVEPSEEYTVAQFQRDAAHASSQIWGAERRVLFVGGTGLYGRAVLDDLDIPSRYPEVRRELDERATLDLASLYAQLEELDPLSASRMEASNERRIVRALEVTLGSGRRFSSYGDGLMLYGPSRVIQVGLDVPLETLDERIELRFRRWMDEGLVDEVVGLQERPGGLGRTARQAVGYRQILAHLEDGQDLEESVSDAITHSRRLARRQRSWFRRDPRVEWFTDPGLAAARLMAVVNDFDGFVRD
ncbi:MAG: tRNA (adenosine(37)-N6)-dimethylallyltransferase MiaA [Acidimicrobiales bacterium]